MPCQWLYNNNNNNNNEYLTDANTDGFALLKYGWMEETAQNGLKEGRQRSKRVENNAGKVKKRGLV